MNPLAAPLFDCSIQPRDEQIISEKTNGNILFEQFVFSNSFQNVYLKDEQKFNNFSFVCNNPSVFGS